MLLVPSSPRNVPSARCTEMCLGGLLGTGAVPFWAVPSPGGTPELPRLCGSPVSPGGSPVPGAALPGWHGLILARAHPGTSLRHRGDTGSGDWVPAGKLGDRSSVRLGSLVATGHRATLEPPQGWRCPRPHRHLRCHRRAEARQGPVTTRRWRWRWRWWRRGLLAPGSAAAAQTSSSGSAGEACPRGGDSGDGGTAGNLPLFARRRRRGGAPAARSGRRDPGMGPHRAAVAASPVGGTVPGARGVPGAARAVTPTPHRDMGTRRGVWVSPGAGGACPSPTALG